LAAVLGVAAILFLVLQADRLVGGTDLDIQIGDGIFRPGPAEDLAEQIAETGPILLSDTAEGDRDLVLTHIGADPNDGWYVFGARPLSAPRDCFVTWMADTRIFVDTCDGAEFDEKGTGLPQYVVAVDPEGIVSINLSSAAG
jgi:hypothetical protein